MQFGSVDHSFLSSNHQVSWGNTRFAMAKRTDPDSVSIALVSNLTFHKLITILDQLASSLLLHCTYIWEIERLCGWMTRWSCITWWPHGAGTVIHAKPSMAKWQGRYWENKGENNQESRCPIPKSAWLLLHVGVGFKWLNDHCGIIGYFVQGINCHSYSTHIAHNLDQAAQGSADVCSVCWCSCLQCWFGTLARGTAYVTLYSCKPASLQLSWPWLLISMIMCKRLPLDDNFHETLLR